MRTIKYGRGTGLKMKKIALKLDRSNRLMFAQMVDYFYRSEKGPLDGAELKIGDFTTPSHHLQEDSTEQLVQDKKSLYIM